MLKKKNILVSIGLPVFNAELYIEEAIESILKQNYTNFELIIVNDGSTDKSVELINKFNDSRIKFLNDGRNKGLPFRLNQITSYANGKYIARMDADDIMHPTRIYEQVGILEDNPEIDVLGTNAYSINGNGDLLGVRYSFDSDNPQITKCNSFIHPSVMGKKTWFETFLYNENLVRCEDAELWHRAYDKSDFKIYNLPLLYYREVGNFYYKKYFNSMESYWSLFVESKDFYWFYKYFKALIVGTVYFTFNLFKLEGDLIAWRNK